MTCLWFVDGLSKKRILTLVLARYMCVLCMCLFCVSAVYVLCVWYVWCVCDWLPWWWVHNLQWWQKYYVYLWYVCKLCDLYLSKVSILYICANTLIAHSWSLMLTLVLHVYVWFICTGYYVCVYVCCLVCVVTLIARSWSLMLTLVLRCQQTCMVVLARCWTFLSWDTPFTSPSTPTLSDEPVTDKNINVKTCDQQKT